jgi:hypothetical protein
MALKAYIHTLFHIKWLMQATFTPGGITNVRLWSPLSTNIKSIMTEYQEVWNSCMLKNK